MTRTALLVWELGAHRGHALFLGAVAERLRARDVTFAFAVQRPDALRAVRSIAQHCAIHQAPVWPGLLRTASFMPAGQPNSMGDILADLGLRDSGAFEYLLRSWDALLNQVRPDVVIADFAPAALAATHGRIPTLATGTGFSLPPAQATRFAALADVNAESLYREDQLLAAANRALANAGRPAIPHLPALFAADATSVRCFAELDPYGGERMQPNDAPYVTGWQPGGQTGQQAGVFAYFGEVTPQMHPALEALPGLGAPTRVYAPGLDERIAQKLTAAGVTVEPRPVPVVEILATSRLVVSHGGTAFVAAALAGGVPQVVIAPDLEKTLVGRAVERLGTGRAVLGARFSRDQVHDTIRQALGDAQLAATAQAKAGEFARRMSNDAIAPVVERALALLALT